VDRSILLESSIVNMMFGLAGFDPCNGFSARTLLVIGAGVHAHRLQGAVRRRRWRRSTS
jgi:hypothetical protein